MINDSIGPYEIVEVLGEGGMGMVYRGLDPLLERSVAIKALRPELAREVQLVERFRSEAVTLGRLNHPNIATLYSFFQEGEAYFMVMEHVAGQTLERVLKTAGALPLGRARAIFGQALEGIGHAHRFGIVHRDIKPANLMLTADDTVKVMDFGIARVLGTARMTRTGRLIGTLEYMAPEQIQGKQGDARADVYALGILLYEMLTGHVPFEADSEYALMQAHVEEAPRPPRTWMSDLPAHVEAVILRALAKAPADRFQTVQALGKALDGARGEAPPAPPDPPPAPTRLASVPIDEVPIDEVSLSEISLDEVSAHEATTDEASARGMPAPERVARATRLARPAPSTRLAEPPSSAEASPAAPFAFAPRYLSAAAGFVALLVVGLWLFAGSTDAEPPSTEPDVAQRSVPSSAQAPAPMRRNMLPPMEEAPPSSAPGAEPLPSEPPSMSPVARWLAQARVHLAEDQLTSPAGANAFELCQRVLAEEPGNEAARALLREIAARYAAWGDAQMERGDPEQALGYYEKSLSVLASDDVARKRDAAAARLAEPRARVRAAPSEPVAPPRGDVRQTVTLPAGTEVRVRLLRTLSSADGHEEGDAVDFAVLDDVVVGGTVLVASGAAARGRIRTEQRGRLFQRGELRFTLYQVEAVDGRTVALQSDQFGIRGARGEDITLAQGTVYLARVARYASPATTPVGLR